MGSQKGIGIEEFPLQGRDLGGKVEVVFHYDLNKRIRGRIVRDDMEEPFRTIIELQDGSGRFVLATECQYRVL